MEPGWKPNRGRKEVTIITMSSDNVEKCLQSTEFVLLSKTYSIRMLLPSVELDENYKIFFYTKNCERDYQHVANVLDNTIKGSQFNVQDEISEVAGSKICIHMTKTQFIQIFGAEDGALVKFGLRFGVDMSYYNFKVNQCVVEIQGGDPKGRSQAEVAVLRNMVSIRKEFRLEPKQRGLLTPAVVRNLRLKFRGWATLILPGHPPNLVQITSYNWESFQQAEAYFNRLLSTGFQSLESTQLDDEEFATSSNTTNAGGYSRIVLTIPFFYHGLIIGKGGHMIKTLQSDYQVRIRVPRLSLRRGHPDLNHVFIEGRLESDCLTAKRAILKMIPPHWLQVDVGYLDDRFQNVRKNVEEMIGKMNCSDQIDIQFAVINGPPAVRKSVLLVAATDPDICRPACDKLVRLWPVFLRLLASPEQCRLIIGIDGKTVNYIQNTFCVIIDIPTRYKMSRSKDNSPSIITIIGTAEKASKARQYILSEILN